MKKYNSDSLVYMKCINLLLMASGKPKYTSDPVVVCNQFSLQDVVKKTHSLSAFCSPCEVRGQGRSFVNSRCHRFGSGGCKGGPRLRWGCEDAP